MSTRLLPIACMLAALSGLAGCSRADSDEPPPPSAAAMAAVAARPGISRTALAGAVDRLFADESAGETRALLVLSGGRIVAERYGAGYGPGVRLPGWSLSKTVTGLLIGLLVADGRLRLDESVPIPAWQRPGDPRGEITLRQLLQMRSGLRHRENGSPVYGSDEVRMMFLDGRDNMATYAEAQPLAAEPGRTWVYSSATSVILADLAARTLSASPEPAARRQAVSDYLNARLFAPLGLRSMVAEFDSAGTLIGSSMIHATPRDWAKLGEFLRNGGSVAGAQVLPRPWVEFMTTPSPRNPGYGAQLWLNRPQVDGKVELLPGRAPASLFAMIGHGGQYVLVSPAQQITVVRMGRSGPDQRAAVLDHLGQIVSLFPRGTR